MNVLDGCRAYFYDSGVKYSHVYSDAKVVITYAYFRCNIGAAVNFMPAV